MPEAPEALLASAPFREAVAQLRNAYGQLPTHPDAFRIVKARDRVHTRFQPLFAPGRIAEIEESEVKDFLAFRNNQHWSSLERLGPRICADMDALRAALYVLVDENRPLAERMTEAISRISGMAKAVATAILHVAYPNKYGVWNNTSEAGLKALHLWPDFPRGTPIGERYTQINTRLTHLATEVGTDLWTLDTLWFFTEVAEEEDEPPSIAEGLQATLSASRFGLERHLHDFLRDNWNETSLGQDWALYSEPGDEEAGYEYPCDVGRIDLLARHRDNSDWLVIELKRGQASDQTIGQVLRYIGWVRKHLAEGAENVRGLIIAREANDRLRYALDPIDFVDLQLYEVEFHLHPPEAL